MLYIRADGNAEIGTGHMMRCLSIAAALQGQGADCRFLLADCAMKEVVEAAGFPVQLLENAAWNHLERELPGLQKQLSGGRRDTLLLDSYFVSPAYLEQLCRWAKVAYLDDLNLCTRPVDLLINYNVYAQELPYQERFGESTRLLLGCHYAPLRREFQALSPFRVGDKVEQVLLTTGGTDALGAAPALLEAAGEAFSTGELVFHVVAGRYSPHREQLEKLAQKPYIRLYQGVEEMAQLMRRCDVAVSAAGTTLYELCACGVPTICYTLADNQLAGAQAFAQRGCMLHAGDIRSDRMAWCKAVLTQLKRLWGDKALRQSMSQKASSLVDGRGAQRLAGALLELATKP